MSATPLAASSLGLSQVGPGGVVYGVVDGYLGQMQLVGGRNNQSIKLLFRHAGQGKEDALKRALLHSPDARASGIKAKHLAVDGNTVRLAIPQGLLNLPDEAVVLSRVKAVLAALKLVSSPEPQTCRSCGSASQAEPLVVKGVVDRVCSSCIERMDEETRMAAAEYESRSPNVLLGLVYALAAGAAGGALYGGVMIATNQMLWILAILTGIMVGYAAMKGAGKGGPLVQGIAAAVTVVSVLAGLLGFIGYQAHQHAAAKGNIINWSVFLSLSPRILVDAGQDSIFSLAGGLFGAVYAIRRIRNPDFAKLRPEEKRSGGGGLLPG